MGSITVVFYLKQKWLLLTIHSDNGEVTALAVPAFALVLRVVVGLDVYDDQLKPESVDREGATVAQQHVHLVLVVVTDRVPVGFGLLQLIPL